MKKFTRPKTCKKFLVDIIDELPFPVYWKDLDSRYLGCNTSFAQHAGWNTPADVIGKTDFEMRWKDVADLCQAEDKFMVTYGAPKLGCEEPDVMSDGQISWIRATKIPVRDPDQKVVGIFGFHDDITELKQAKEAEETLSRALALLTKSQAQLISSETEAQFLVSICKLLVEDGGYQMTWIGLQDKNGGKILRPAAQAHLDHDLPGIAHITVRNTDEGKHGSGIPTEGSQEAEAAESNSCTVNGPKQNRTPGEGYLSGIAIPLTHRNQLLGAINVYTSEISEFLDQEIRLLEELAKNVAFGLYCLRLHAREVA